LENLDAEKDFNSALDAIMQYVKISAKENIACFKLKKHKS
jgi:hypothetical protein